jgi:hypothetical protein
MDPTAKVLERLRRIDALEEERAPAPAVLAEVRALLREAEEWVRREGDERAECALERCRAALASTTIAV